jgi:hypothetical protein
MGAGFVDLGFVDYGAGSRDDAACTFSIKGFYMAAVAFDTLKMVDQLQAGGFSPEQARAASSAFAEAMSGAELATKHDLQATESRLQHEIVVVRAEAKAMEERLGAKIEATELKIQSVELKIESANAALKADILRWMFAAMATQTALLVGLIVGLMKLFN